MTAYKLWRAVHLYVWLIIMCAHNLKIFPPVLG